MLSHMDFRGGFDMAVDFVTYSGCGLAMGRFLRGGGFGFCSGSVIGLAACLRRLCEAGGGCRSCCDVLNQGGAGPGCCSGWEDGLRGGVPWRSCFRRLGKIRDVGVEWFRMRVVHWVLGAGVVLGEMGVANGGKCSFCHGDTVQHVFWECGRGRRFWARFLVLLRERCASCYGCLVFWYYLVLMMASRRRTFLILFCYWQGGVCAGAKWRGSPRTLIYLERDCCADAEWRSAVLGWAARVRVSLPGGNHAGLFLRASCALICLFFLCPRSFHVCGF